jgi:hypothetical protein
VALGSREPRSYASLRHTRHITLMATLRTLCARAHKVRENRLHGSEGGEGESPFRPLCSAVRRRRRALNSWNRSQYDLEGTLSLLIQFEGALRSLQLSRSLWTATGRLRARAPGVKPARHEQRLYSKLRGLRWTDCSVKPVNQATGSCFGRRYTTIFFVPTDSDWNHLLGCCPVICCRPS